MNSFLRDKIASSFSFNIDILNLNILQDKEARNKVVPPPQGSNSQ